MGNLELLVSPGDGERGVLLGDRGTDLSSLACDRRNAGMGDCRDDFGFSTVNLGTGDSLRYGPGDLDWSVGLLDKTSETSSPELINR